MNSNISLVITSISHPENKVLQDYARKTSQHGFNYIIAGDEKSPEDFFIEGCHFLSLKRQRESGFSLAELLPTRHYARKNIGYLEAMRAGSHIIVETDDDNYAKADFWEKREACVQARLYENEGWLNVFKLFSEQNIWPRGFSLKHINNIPENKSVEQSCYCPIQQGLADENPDVDAIYRMILPLPVTFGQAPNVVIGNHTWCPFNSQNTTWFKEAFPLMYLPSYCSFRMTDIWRSFVAQRICWENEMGVLFHHATVWQERNEHDLLVDFRDEFIGYMNNNILVERLNALTLRKGAEHIPANLLACYQVFIDMNLIAEKELDLLHAWIEDVYLLTK
ncbi:MAG: STELLO glycosyltransferase family protein [Tannerella sp.]|jgi:hypothetical protein|nr:STELLO glycosyltransferase family protein [Tannerella sp.]